jgi:hypothetical protein
MRHHALRRAVAGVRAAFKAGSDRLLLLFRDPKIFLRKSALYEPERLRNFPSFYADGFFELCSALALRGWGKIAVFHPSTVAIDEGLSNTAEYAMAKVAGETLANHLNQFMSNDIQVLCRRLPRILTD